MKEKLKNVGLGVSLALLSSPFLVFAETGNTGITEVESIINSTSSELLSSSTGVIKAGIGIGVVFFGAKLLWGKFKSMAK